MIPHVRNFCLRPTDSFDVSVLLLLALTGDVELNPGPSWDSSKSRCDDASQWGTRPARGENLIASDKPSLLSPSSGITIVHLNIRSLLGHFDQLTEFVRDHSPDIVAISETWLDDSVDDSVLAVPGYNVHRADRHRHGGGVAIYAAANLVCNSKRDYCCGLIGSKPRPSTLWQALKSALPRPTQNWSCYTVRMQRNLPASSTTILSLQHLLYLQPLVN